MCIHPPHPRPVSGGPTRAPCGHSRLHSEVSWWLCGLPSALACNGPASLLPDGQAVTGANLLGVLEQASRARDDATGQPWEGQRSGVKVWGGLSRPHPSSVSPPLTLGPRAHLFPELPVILDKGWPPWPKSSSPSSITRLRPITSHTWEGDRALDAGPVRKAPSPVFPTLPSVAHPRS